MPPEFALPADPLDSVPMLIRADWLEEHGDGIGAAVLRGLARAGVASLHALALDAALTCREDYWNQGPLEEDTGRGDGDYLSRDTLERSSGIGHGLPDVVYCDELDGPIGIGSGEGECFEFEGEAKGLGEMDGFESHPFFERW